MKRTLALISLLLPALPVAVACAGGDERLDDATWLEPPEPADVGSAQQSLTRSEALASEDLALNGDEGGSDDVGGDNGGDGLGGAQDPAALKRGADIAGGIGGGGLNAWGCWDSCCESRCIAYHWEAGPLGWYYVCDAYECVDECERCIWPW